MASVAVGRQVTVLVLFAADVVARGVSLGDSGATLRQSFCVRRVHPTRGRDETADHPTFLINLGHAFVRPSARYSSTTFRS